MEKFKLTVTEGGNFVITASDDKVTIYPYYRGQFKAIIKDGDLESTVICKGEFAEIRKLVKHLAAVAAFFDGNVDITRGGDER